MSTVMIVEIKRCHWSEKVIRKSFNIIGTSPYATALELLDTSRKVTPHEKGSRAWRISKCYVCMHEDKSKFLETRVNHDRNNIGNVITRRRSNP